MHTSGHDWELVSSHADRQAPTSAGKLAMGKPNIREQIIVALHVAAWSQVGVLVRIYLDKFFTGGCSGEWGVCLLSQGTSPQVITHNFLS